MLKPRKLFLKAVLVLLCLAQLNSCREMISQNDTAQFECIVYVQDTSGISQAINQNTGHIGVGDAQIELNSMNHGIQFKGNTDRAGWVVFSNILPDFYNCYAQKVYPKDTVRKYLDISQEITLVGSLSAQALRSKEDSLVLTLTPVISSDLLISEIYYNGALPKPPYYFHDQFTEIYNNSLEVKYLDNYAIGDIDYGHRDDAQFLYCIHLYKFPGAGQDYPIQPGEMIVVAQDAINHLEFNTNSLDLTIADFEYYNPLSSDVPNPEVPNMIQIHHKYGIDFLYSVFNDAVILFELQPGDTSWTYSEFDLIKVPFSRAVDGVEYREDLSEFEYKRLSDFLDSGITGGMPAYKGKSIARKILKEIDGQLILMDNNNSGIDFRVLDKPTPKVIE